MGAIEDIRKVMQDFLAPELRAIRTELTAITKLLDKIDDRFDRMEGRFDDLRREVKTDVQNFREEMRERLAVVKLESRMEKLEQIGSEVVREVVRPSELSRAARIVQDVYEQKKEVPPEREKDVG